MTMNGPCGWILGPYKFRSVKSGANTEVVRLLLNSDHGTMLSLIDTRTTRVLFTVLLFALVLGFLRRTPHSGAFLLPSFSLT
jgi:hypothetical protein